MTTEKSRVLAQAIENASASAKRAVQYRFTPVWDAKREVVTMYRLALRQLFGEREKPQAMSRLSWEELRQSAS
jgi:hypothetical protein